MYKCIENLFGWWSQFGSVGANMVSVFCSDLEFLVLLYFESVGFLIILDRGGGSMNIDEPSRNANCESWQWRKIEQWFDDLPWFVELIC